MKARALTTLTLAAAAVLLSPATASAGDKDEMEVAGFGDDATFFAYWTFGAYDGSGKVHAELNVYSTLTGRKAEAESRSLEADPPGPALPRLKAREAKHLEALKLGRDRGLEMYKSGTALATQFTVDGKKVEVRLDVRKGQPDPDTGLRDDSVSIRLAVDGAQQTLFVGRGGWDYSLNSVRLSADHRSIAVLVKHSTRGFEGANRRYLCGAGRMARK